MTRTTNDYYPTPAAVTEGLLDIAGYLISPSDVIFDPAAGNHAILQVVQDKLNLLVLGNELYPDDQVNYRYDSKLDATDPSSWLIFDKQLRDEEIPGFDWAIMNPPFDKDLMFPIVQNAYDHANKGIMTLCRLSWLEPCETKLKNEYGGNTLNDWGMYDDRASWFKDINDQIRHFIPINPRPRFIKNQKGSDNVTVAWLVIDKRFSWIDQGVVSPFQFITGWKK
jgi:hypothetical protein